MRWLNYHFWSYLLKRPFSIKKFICRVGGHKCGPIYYNSTELEPNMHCRNCDDDLG